LGLSRYDARRHRFIRCHHAPIAPENSRLESRLRERWHDYSKGNAGRL
jgi:hypothetical protein